MTKILVDLSEQEDKIVKPQLMLIHPNTFLVMQQSRNL